jgi:hypothetical protein
LVHDLSRDRVGIRFDNGREQAMTPRVLLRHLDYGYAGTTHKVLGQTSAVHIASLGPTKNVASPYVSASRARDVSASRARERTLFVADARDYLTDQEMRTASQWNPNDLDDEVLDRVHKVLAARVEQIDSPSRASRPHRETNTPMHRPGAPGMGMSM